jgi:HEAT repeat protein
MKPTVSKALLQLKTSGRFLMWEAAKVLVREEDRRVVPHLLKLLARSQEPERRVAAAWTLGFLRAKGAVQPLIDVLADKSEPPVLREHAAEALGYLSDSRAREALISNLEDEDPDVVFSSAFALRTVGELRDVPALTKLAQSSSLVNSTGQPVSKEALEAIEQIRERANRDSRPDV